MKNCVFILVFVVILLNGCKKSETLTSSEISIDLEKGFNNKNCSVFPDSISYVFLETTADNLIGSIDKFMCVNGKFFILDRYLTNTVYCFDGTGKFLYKIDKQGKGPGEYIKINDFYVDDSETVYVYDNETKRILNYTNAGRNFTENQLDSYFFEFVVLNEDEILVRNLYAEGKTVAALAKIHIKTQKQVQIIKSHDVFNDLGIPNYCEYYLYKSGQRFFYNPRFTNEIVCFDANTNKLHSIIKFENEDYFPDPSYVKDLKVRPTKLFQSDEYIGDIQNIYETDKFIVFNYIRGLLGVGAYDKDEKKFCVVNSLEADGYLGRNYFIGTYKNMFYSVLEDSSVGDPQWIKKVEQSSLQEKEKRAIFNHSPISNPVLVCFKLRTNDE